MKNDLRELQRLRFQFLKNASFEAFLSGFLDTNCLQWVVMSCTDVVETCSIAQIERKVSTCLASNF